MRAIIDAFASGRILFNKSYLRVVESLNVFWWSGVEWGRKLGVGDFAIFVFRFSFLRLLTPWSIQDAVLDSFQPYQIWRLRRLFSD